MAHCLALRHVPFEDLGLLLPALEARGYTVRYLDTPVDGVDAEAITKADLVVALGGPVGACQTDRFPWLGAETAALGSRLGAGKPTLGICLGAQLMARALGASVAPGDAPEIGWAPVTLTDRGHTSPLAALDGLPVLHWHGDGFAVPANADHLAYTDRYAVQAVSLGTHALALQFHPEVDPDRFEWWLVANGGQLDPLGLDPDVLRADARRHASGLRTALPDMLRRWLG